MSEMKKEAENNFKNDCIEFIATTKMSESLAQKVEDLKSTIPGLSTHEAIEILLDSFERLSVKDIKKSKSILVDFKKIFTRSDI